jgi:hypothetical protein
MNNLKSKIATIQGNGTWDTPDGKTLYKFEVTTESGDTGMVFKQSQDSGYAVGQEIEYYLDAKGSLKIPKKAFVPKGSGSSGLTKEEWKEKDRIIIKQACLKAACSYLSSTSSTQDVLTIAV